MAILSLVNVSFEYPNGFLAVDDVSLDVEKGENVAIVGQNGAGKTTTVKLCNNLLRPTRGDVLVGERNTKDHTTAQISRVVGYVFQNPDDQIFHSNIADEVAFGPKMMKWEDEKIEAAVKDALELVGLAGRGEDNPYDLPLSVRKFVTIASVIAMDTEVLIFDEPTAGQDRHGNATLRELLGTLQGRGKTLITISHDMEFVAESFQRVIVMAEKKVICDGAPEDVFWNFEALGHARLMQPYVSRVCRGLGIGGNIIRMDDAVDAIAALGAASAMAGPGI